jgi:hypothetical protein
MDLVERSWQRILMIQDAESFGFVENVTDTMKFMKFFLLSFKTETIKDWYISKQLQQRGLEISFNYTNISGGQYFIHDLHHIWNKTYLI